MTTTEVQTGSAEQSTSSEIIALPNGFTIRRKDTNGWTIQHDKTFNMEVIELPIELTKFIKPGDNISLKETFVGHSLMKTLIIPEFFKQFFVTSLDRTFKDCTQLSDLSFVRNINTLKCKRCQSTFEGCVSANSFSFVTIWKLSACKTMQSMFSRSNIKTINFLKNMQVSKNLNNISYMFSNCNQLKDVTGIVELIGKVSPKVNSCWVFKDCHNAVQSMQKTPLNMTIQHTKHAYIKLYTSPDNIVPKFEYSIRTTHGIKQPLMLSAAERTQSLYNTVMGSPQIHTQPTPFPQPFQYSPTYGDFNPQSSTLIGNDRMYQHPQPISERTGDVYNAMRVNPMESPEYKALQSQLEQYRLKCNGLEFNLSDSNRRNEELKKEIERMSATITPIDDNANIVITKENVGSFAKAFYTFLINTFDKDDHRWSLYKSRTLELATQKLN